jgi:hypothetical protein
VIPKKNPKTAWRTIAGEGVILSLDTKVLRGLNAVGARVWELIDGERSIEAISQEIVRDFKIDPARALADVGEFVEDLLTRGLVEPSGSPS